MAKPIPVAARDGATSSSSPHPSIQDRKSAPRSRRRASRPRSSFPSPTLLSVLASIVASSPVVASSPAPLPFLCPSLAQTISPSHQTIHPRSTTPSPPRLKARHPDKKSRNRPLPLKFEPGEDGVWRSVEVYTLYGSTVCSASCRESTNAVSSDEVNTNAAPNTPVTTAGAIDLSDSLPVGWNAATMRSESRTTLILALSLVLASFICFFMIGCLFWRKNVRRKHKAGDVEMKARRKSRPNPTTPPPAQPQIEVEKGAKKMIWARATARWKANARYIARQRRGKRPSSIRSQPLDSSTTLQPSTTTDPPDDRVSTTQSALHSVSRYSSNDSLRESSPSVSCQPQENTDDLQIPSAPTSDSSGDPPSLPPAYRRGTHVTPNVTTSAGTLSISDDRTASSGPRLSRLHTDTSSPGPKSSIEAQQANSPQIPIHAAHVATDDKALLARLADLAERPPDVPDAESSHQVSVPVWEDEQLEDFAQTPQFSEPDTSGSAPHSQFPPPPTKGKMAESSFYAYRYSFEEFSESIEPDLEPSAPPFEAPGAPVTNDMVMLPSAPPLAAEDFEHSDTPQFQADATDAEQGSSDRLEGDGNGDDASRPLSNGTLPGYQP